jgi:beta-glucuronidase
MLKSITISFCLFFFFFASAPAQSGLIINIHNRTTTSLNGKWHYIMDPYETGYYDYRYMPYDSDESRMKNTQAYFNNAKAKTPQDRVEYNFDESPTLSVPGDWNSQEEKLLYYEGTIWYKKSFDYEKPEENNRVFLHFGAVNYIAEVYLNGQKLGTHEGGFTPFSFDITDVMQPSDNYLIVKVDNTRFKSAVPTLNTDWWNYGGITRDVTLVEVPSTYISDYFIQLKKGTKDEIAGYISLANSEKDTKIELTIPELGLSKQLRVNDSGKVEFAFNSPNIERWSPENPKLYDVTITTPQETLKDRIGFRTIETRGNQIFLNGSPIFLRGICMHEENTMRGGRAYSREDALVAFTWAKELNCNFMRLAHYPHNEHAVRLADEMGILLWEEIPVYWTVDFTSEEVYQKAQNQLEEMINRDKNRACSIIWSMSNETPQGEHRNEFLTRLINRSREMDPTRLVSAALQHKTTQEGIHPIDDPIASKVDILAFNQYIGWYGGHPKNLPENKWYFGLNKPVVISEFGAGALAGHHADKNTRWTEEYQEYLYEQSILMMKKMPDLSGVSPWILADFRSPKRNLAKIQDGWNRKGLISNTGNKKKAFYVMQEWYEKLKKDPPK